MNKEDILQKSRDENGTCDEREKAIKLRSYAISATVGAFLCIVFILIEEIAFHRDANLIWGIYSGIMFTKYILDAIRLKKPFDIVLSVIWGLSFTLFIAKYISANIG